MFMIFLYDHNWSANKSISLKASDMSGSGIDGYSLVSEKEECSSFSKSNTFNITVNGSYKYCVKDKAGNITSDMVVIDKLMELFQTNLILYPMIILKVTNGI